MRRREKRKQLQKNKKWLARKTFQIMDAQYFNSLRKFYALFIGKLDFLKLTQRSNSHSGKKNFETFGAKQRYLKERSLQSSSENGRESSPPQLASVKEESILNINDTYSSPKQTTNRLLPSSADVEPSANSLKSKPSPQFFNENESQISKI